MNTPAPQPSFQQVREAISRAFLPIKGFGRIIETLGWASDGPHQLPEVAFTGGRRVALYFAPEVTSDERIIWNRVYR